MSKRDGKMRLKAGERLSLVRSHGHQDLGITESLLLEFLLLGGNKSPSTVKYVYMHMCAFLCCLLLHVAGIILNSISKL